MEEGIIIVWIRSLKIQTSIIYREKLFEIKMERIL